MNTPETSPLQAGVAAIRDQIQTLAGRRTGRAGKPVTVRRVGGRGSSWRITASLSGTAARRSVSFTRREVKLGADRIVLSEPGLEIIAAGLEDDTFTLLIAEAQETLAGAHETLDDAGTLLRQAEETLTRLQEPARQIAAMRALRAVTRAIANAPLEPLTRASTAATDVEVLIHALQQPDAIETLQAEDPLGPARLRGLQEREKLLAAEGGTYSAEQVAKHLKISRQAVNKRRQQGTLVGLDAGRHGYLYPAWQFVRSGTLPRLEAVLGALEGHDPWMRHIFMVSGNARLQDRSPLEQLRQGGNRLDDVLSAARTFGEHGAA